MRALEDEVYIGDRLEFNRVMYSHWGIYVGEYENEKHAVIHFGMFEGGAAFSKKKISGSASSASRKPEIRADPIRKVLGNFGLVRINNIRDKIVKCLDLGVIIRVATEMHRDEKPINYNLFERNCEHFVNLCRYGKAHSEQVDAGKETLLTAIWPTTRMICSIIHGHS
ncbi:phospholipase A and acyltransferase 3-like [Patiria miniata]|uniref:LRAT domain-containing protein n=1 Tax=Patiria miniata TaxID=46514 RepID=A0A914AEL4_PATMI|nr:phospholipase A and acyltransferase 3-like [Patiria miniata]